MFNPREKLTGHALWMLCVTSPTPSNWSSTLQRSGISCGSCTSRWCRRLIFSSPPPVSLVLHASQCIRYVWLLDLCPISLGGNFPSLPLIQGEGPPCFQASQPDTSPVSSASFLLPLPLPRHRFTLTSSIADMSLLAVECRYTKSVPRSTFSERPIIPCILSACT